MSKFTHQPQNELHLTPVSSDAFTSHRLSGLTAKGKPTYELITEASQLDNLDRGLWWLQPADAETAGIGIKSERSGVIVRFRLTRIDRQNGEIIAWHFEPLDELEARKATGVVAVTIFND